MFVIHSVFHYVLNVKLQWRHCKIHDCYDHKNKYSKQKKKIKYRSGLEESGEYRLLKEGEIIDTNFPVSLRYGFSVPAWKYLLFLQFWIACFFYFPFILSFIHELEAQNAQHKFMKLMSMERKESLIASWKISPWVNQYITY